MPDMPNDWPRRGININDGSQNYTGQILRGDKTVETRGTDSLKPCVGERVGLIRTHPNQKNRVIGYADLGQPKVYTSSAEFDADYDLHRVSPDSPHHISRSRTGLKLGYPLSNVQVEQNPYKVETRGHAWRYL
jgi:hypothetical protein